MRCMPVKSRAYGDAEMEIRCADRPEVYGIDVDRLVGGAQVLVRRGECWTSWIDGESTATRFELRSSPSASWRSRRVRVAEPQPLGAQPQAGRRPRRMACSAAAVAVMLRAQPQHGQLRASQCDGYGAHSPSRQRRQVGAAPWSTVAGCVSCLLSPQFTAVPGSQNGCVSLRLVLRFRLTGHGRTHG
eukprot:scaffold6599_cov62-Phaeocystis_antarctica.AAC.4